MTDYDSPWKNVLERYFPDFLAFFFPGAHAGIDWSRGYTLLDKELQKVVRDAKLGRRWADSLVRVTGRDGQDDWVLVHVEVQGQDTSDFAQRMFVYNYRLYDRHARPVVSLAVLGEAVPGEFGTFGYQRWGCRMELRFPVVNLTDYRARWAELDASSNPFAVVTQAHLEAQETAGSDDARYRAKLALIRSLYRRGYQRTEILELFRFIDWVLVLPEGLEGQLWTEVQQFAEEKRMRYVSSFERIAQERGIEQGIEQGIEKGIEKGVGKGQARLLKLLIQQRFGVVPAEVDVRLQAATPEQLEAWALRVLSAPTLDAVFEEGGVH